MLKEQYNLHSRILYWRDLPVFECTKNKFLLSRYIFKNINSFIEVRIMHIDIFKL